MAAVRLLFPHLSANFSPISRTVDLHFLLQTILFSQLSFLARAHCIKSPDSPLFFWHSFADAACARREQYGRLFLARRALEFPFSISLPPAGGTPNSQVCVGMCVCSREVLRVSASGERNEFYWRLVLVGASLFCGPWFLWTPMHGFPQILADLIASTFSG